MSQSSLRLGLLVSVLAVVVSACAQPNKQLYYGTWRTEKGQYQRVVHTPDGLVANHRQVSDATPTERASVQIVRCWSDSEGNVWFKTQGTILEGPHKNTVPKIQTLEKISKSGTFLEVMLRGVVDFSPKSFPIKIDPNDPYLYMSFVRAQ